MNTKKHADSIRKTLKARIIPNMPLSSDGSHGKAAGYGHIRKFIEKTIDNFEFEWHLKEMVRKKEGKKNE